MNDEEYDEEYEVIEPPAWKFSLWDLAGIAMHTTSGIFVALSHGAGLLAQECAASANRSRNVWDVREEERKDREAQEAIGADLRALIEGPEDQS